MSEKGAV